MALNISYYTHKDEKRDGRRMAFLFTFTDIPGVDWVRTDGKTLEEAWNRAKKTRPGRKPASVKFIYFTHPQRRSCP